ncbi:MAG TPA: nitroreductase family deazaflavin-dependent oxidoreductase [Ktedonobacterales bacterium]
MSASPPPNTNRPWWSQRFIALHTRLYRATGGRIGHRLGPQRTLLLTTTGRKSSLPRTLPLAYFHVGDTLIIVASNWGNDHPPAWYFNILAHPCVHIQLKGDTFDATATTATPEERARLWPQVVAQNPVYARYQAGATREIPLVLLHRTSSAS